LRKHEDPRLSFSTPEFREAQRVFTDNFKVTKLSNRSFCASPGQRLTKRRRRQKNFGKPVEYGFVKKHEWSKPQLVKLETPVDVDGNPWPLDNEGKPILKS